MYQVVKRMVLKGFLVHCSQLPVECRWFWSVREHLMVDNDLVMYGCHLLIPSEMRRQTLVHLHESQQGVVRTKQRALLTVYWPGIDNDIDNMIVACKHCQDHLSSNQKEPITSKMKPT